MFSYTDEAIVTSSPTGRHLSIVIRRPAGMPDDQWRKHADQVCQVLNELDSKAKANSLSLHLQTVGRVKRIAADRDTYIEELRSMYGGPSFAELIDQGYLSPLSFGVVPPAGPTPGATGATLASTRIAELEKCISSLETECSNARDRLSETEKQLDDATTKLAAAQMLLEKPIEVTADLGPALRYLPKGVTVTHNNRTFKRVE